MLAGDTKMVANIGHIHALSRALTCGPMAIISPAPAGYGMRESNNENTLTIEGSDQYLDPAYEANIRHLAFGKDYAYLAGDATVCYPKEAGSKAAGAARGAAGAGASL